MISPVAARSRRTCSRPSNKKISGGFSEALFLLISFYADFPNFGKGNELIEIFPDLEMLISFFGREREMIRDLEEAWEEVSLTPFS